MLVWHCRLLMMETFLKLLEWLNQDNLLPFCYFQQYTVSGQSIPGSDPYQIFKEFVLQHRERIIGLIETANINKTVIKRSACLRALIQKVASDNMWDRVHLIDIGCSAGLNLLMDYWRINYLGVGEVGPTDSSVYFSINLTNGGAPPLGDLPEFLSRTGLDLDSFNLENEADQRWLLGCLIPDCLETFEATRMAMPLLSQYAPRIVVGDAGAVLPSILASIPGNEPIIIMHSLVLCTMTPYQKQAIFRAIQKASELRPVARVCMEYAQKNCLLSISYGKDGGTMNVGEADADGSWMTWY